MAEQLGATVVINGGKKTLLHAVSNFTEDMGADIVLKQRVLRSPLNRHLYLVMRGGKIMIVGTVPGDSAINFQNQSRSHYPDGIPLCQSLSGHD